jgi:hypothetical protein
MSVATSGVAIALGGLLVVAGALKLWHPNPFGWALLRLFPIGWSGWKIVRPFRVATAVGLIEVTVGIGVIAGRGSFGQAMAMAAAVLFVSFTAAVAVAVRNGVGCGCWSSLSDGPATGAEMGRALLLAASAVGLAVSQLLRSSRVEWSLGAGVSVLGLLISAWGAMRVGGMLRPARTKAMVRGPLGSASRFVREAASLAGVIGHRSGHRPPPAAPGAR